MSGIGYLYAYDRYSSSVVSVTLTYIMPIMLILCHPPPICHSAPQQMTLNYQAWQVPPRMNQAVSKDECHCK